VFDGISVKDDLLGQWIKSIDGLEPISYRNSEIIANYGKIMNYIRTSGFYSAIALKCMGAGKQSGPLDCCRGNGI
jgi:hypothetical protein